MAHQSESQTCLEVGGSMLMPSWDVFDFQNLYEALHEPRTNLNYVHPMRPYIDRNPDIAFVEVLRRPI